MAAFISYMWCIFTCECMIPTRNVITLLVVSMTQNAVIAEALKPCMPHEI